MIEKKLIKEFNNKFELIAGNEYFRGDEIAMKKCFRQIVFDCIDNINNIEDTYQKFEEQRERKIQEKKKEKEKKIQKIKEEKERKIQERKEEKERKIREEREEQARKMKEKKEKKNKKETCDGSTFLEWFNDNYEKGDENDIIKLKDLYEIFKSSDNYKNLTKELKRKYNKKKMTKDISESVLLKKYYRNDQKQINGFSYTERLHNYKKKI